MKGAKKQETDEGHRHPPEKIERRASNNNKKKRGSGSQKGEEIERDAAPSHLWQLALSRRNIDPSKRNEGTF